jgi:ABC-type Fe3+ transport system permease subunit
MSSTHHRSRWRLTPWGWILAAALLVLVILAIIAPSSSVIIGLIVVIILWAALLNARFPSSQMQMRSRFPGEPGRDFGEQAATRYEREHH